MFPSYICQMPPDANVDPAEGQDDYITATLFPDPRARLSGLVLAVPRPHFYGSSSFLLLLHHLSLLLVHSCYMSPISRFRVPRMPQALIKIASFLLWLLLPLLFFFPATNGRCGGFLFPRGHKLKKRETVKEYLDVTHTSL